MTNCSTTAIEFESFLANALLSPIWYPPRGHDVEYLAKRLERRMWAQTWVEDRFGSGVAMEAMRGIERIGPLPDDSDVGIDYGKVNSLYNTHIREQLGHDAYAGDVEEESRRYLDGTSEQVRDWRAAYAPIFTELARPAPLEYPLPGYVQAYVKQVARLDSRH
jgi:hypothetical protein